ncbi:Hint domain-containing protein [Gymnodinialimonas ulvae]|uniref:Hint domain-containing protein n=1 Tax=Gymnodinialimonas ulvae TaxID=3126504 RepID=UPI003096EDF7
MAKHPPLLRFPIYPAAALHGVAGANTGDAIGVGDAALPGDIYRLRGGDPTRLAISETGPSGQSCVADGSDVGAPGDPLAILACHMLMGPSGEMVEVLILSLMHRGAESLHILPLADLRPETDYELVGTETAAAPDRFADIASVRFLAGTHLTLASGKQVPVEHLSIGDRLLTRDHGAQPIRWIGHQTRRATGRAAPVRLKQETLNTARDLRLAPQHRLFIWQRHDELGAGRAEVMVKAELLVNGDTVLREDGGYLDNYQIVFDGHEIIYAEGIAVESLLVTGQTRNLLPKDLAVTANPDAPASAAALEVSDGQADMVGRLSRASKGGD